MFNFFKKKWKVGFSPDRPDARDYLEDLSKNTTNIINNKLLSCALSPNQTMFFFNKNKKKKKLPCTNSASLSSYINSTSYPISPGTSINSSGQTISGSQGSSSTTTTGPGPGNYYAHWNPGHELFWPEEQRELLAKIGFVFNPEKNKWILSLTAEVELHEPQGVMGFISSHSTEGDAKTTAIKEMDRLKDNLIKKLTAKIILAELLKPRNIEK